MHGDSQMETSLLCSCLSLLKVSFIFYTCPINHIRHAAVEFDTAISVALESTIGRPMSDWSWLKASLPSNLGALNIRRASLHTPAAFLAFFLKTSQTVERIPGLPSGPPHFSSILASLAVATDCPEWCDLGNIDVPLQQRFLSHAIDKALHCLLLSSAPNTCSRALALSTGLPYAGDWLN